MPKWKVLELTNIRHSPQVFDKLSRVADITHLEPTPEALEANLPDHDAYVTSLQVRLTADLIERAPRLRVVASSSTGLDHIDLNALEARGIELICLKHETDFLSNITCTAEMGWALLLAVVRKLPWSFAAAQRGEWARDRFRGHQLAGRTLGILGYGRLGRIMGHIGRGFRMRVIAHDVRDVTPDEGVERVDLDTLLSESDVLSIHIHLTPENTGFVGADAFAKMKPTAFLINTSRGAILDEPAFLEALESGRIAGAGVDVIHGEWDDNIQEHPLIQYARTHENLVISPHTGGVTFEAQAMALGFTCDRLAEYLEKCE